MKNLIKAALLTLLIPATSFAAGFIAFPPNSKEDVAVCLAYIMATSKEAHDPAVDELKMRSLSHEDCEAKLRVRAKQDIMVSRRILMEDTHPSRDRRQSVGRYNKRQFYAEQRKAFWETVLKTLEEN